MNLQDLLKNILSSLKAFFLPNRQAKQLQKNDRYGFSLDDHVVLPAPKRLFNCLLRGILIFLLVYTPIDMINSAFEIDYQQVMVVTALFFIALAIGMINFNGISRSVGYILIFIAFLFGAISMRQVINSGFNAILNIISEYASYELNTEAIRTYEETITARTLTIPSFYIFVGIVTLIFLNFTLNNFMSAPFILVCSVPFWTLSFYFDAEPKTWHYVVYAFCLMTIAILKRSNQYNLPDGNKLNQVHRTRKRHTYRNISNGVVMCQTAGFIAMILVVLMVLSSVFYPANRLRTPYHWNQLKESTEDYARIYFSQGLMGFFNNREAEGGINMGRLGAGRVNPSFETDFNITFAPASYESIYVRCYIGTTYTGYSWEDIAPVYLDSWLAMEHGTYLGLDEAYQALSEEEQAKSGIYGGRMLFHTLDYDIPSFMPYYSINPTRKIYYQQFIYPTDGGTVPLYHDKNLKPYVYNFSSVYAGFGNPTYDSYLVPGNDYYETTYFNYKDLNKDGFLSQYDYIPDINAARQAQYTFPTNTAFEIRTDAWSMLQDVYLDVCEDNVFEYDVNKFQSMLISICEEQNFHGTALEITAQVADYLENNFRYTLNPGRYPSNSMDFATYFLTKNPNGYCSHFATAATLLLRTMGIPARYVEGYFISFDSMINGTILGEEDYTEWLWGDYELDNSVVLSVDVRDATAHAWTEIYLPGLGWYPVEVTTAALAEPDEDPYDFWNNVSDRLDSIDTSGLENLMNADLSFVWNFIQTTVLLLLSGGVLFILGLIIYRFLNRKKAGKPFHEGYALQLLQHYYALCRTLRSCRITTGTEQLLHSDFQELSVSSQWLSKEEAVTLQQLLDLAAFGPIHFDRQEAQQAHQLLKGAEKQCGKQLSILRKLNFYRCCLVNRLRFRLQRTAMK